MGRVSLGRPCGRGRGGLAELAQVGFDPRVVILASDLGNLDQGFKGLDLTEKDLPLAIGVAPVFEQAGKHRENFPLNEYMDAFNCRFQVMGNKGPYMAKFQSAEEMAAVMVELTDLREMMDDALVVSRMLFEWPEFREIGMQGLIERYYPWWAFMSIKRPARPKGGKMMKEARILMNLDTAVTGQANLFW